MREYIQVGYSLDIERKPEGDSKLVNDLMGKLEAICEKHEGYPFREGLVELGHEGDPSFENDFKPAETQECARNRTRYLVGTVWVENNVDLFNGNMGTSVIYESGSDAADLLKDFDKIYEKGEKVEYKTRVPDDKGKKY
jgi:hypothetical protein